MLHRSRLAPLALSTTILLGFLAACSKPAAEAPPAAAAEAAPAAAADPAPPPPPAPAEAAAPVAAAAMAAAAADKAAITTINLSNCETAGNKGQTTVIDWQPTDPNADVQVRWTKQGNGQGMRVVIKPLAEQSTDPVRNGKILAMFDARYEIAADTDGVLSKLPKDPPFENKEVRWKYQVQVLNAQGKVICGLDPDICIREPGGCQN